MSYNLFLDDSRIPLDCATYMHRFGTDCKIYHEDWIIARSYKQFCDMISEKGLPEKVAFDHDLGDVPELKETLAPDEYYDFENNKEYTGMDAAKWLVNYCIDNNVSLPQYIVHSANPAGRDNIQSLLDNYSKHVGIAIEIETQLWWGYKHISGTYQAKRYYDERDTQEAEESEFVAQVVYPFRASDRDQAIEYIKSQTN